MSVVRWWAKKTGQPLASGSRFCFGEYSAIYANDMVYLLGHNALSLHRHVNALRLDTSIQSILPEQTEATISKIGRAHV